MSESAYTKMPNGFFELLPVLKPAELNISLAIIRKTCGYHKEWAEISIADFMKTTGLTKQGVLNGIEAGLARGTIKRIEQGRGFLYGFSTEVKAEEPAEIVNAVDMSTKLTSQRGRPSHVNEVDTLEPQIVNAVDMSAGPYKELKENTEKENTKETRMAAPPRRARKGKSKREVTPEDQERKNAAARIIAFFCEEYKSRRTVNPVVSGKESAAVLKLLETLPEIELREVIPKYLDLPGDNYLISTGWSLCGLPTRINALRSNGNGARRNESKSVNNIFEMQARRAREDEEDRGLDTAITS